MLTNQSIYKLKVPVIAGTFFMQIILLNVRL